MKLIGAALVIYAAQWASLPLIEDQWTFLLGTSCLITALLVTEVSVLCRESDILIRSVLVLWALNAWADVLKFAVWAATDTHLDLSAPLTLLFAAWMLFVARRRYDILSASISPDVVVILIKRPSGWLDLAKGLFGAPASSVCICVNQTVWAYRKRSGKFEMSSLSRSIRDRHIVIDTGVSATDEMLGKLDSLRGTSRGVVPCKCLWTIRGVLNMIGGKYAIKSWLDYVPGFYVMRVL